VDIARRVKNSGDDLFAAGCFVAVPDFQPIAGQRVCFLPGLSRQMTTLIDDDRAGGRNIRLAVQILQLLQRAASQQHQT